MFVRFVTYKQKLYFSSMYCSFSKYAKIKLNPEIAAAAYGHNLTLQEYFLYLYKEAPPKYLKETIKQKHTKQKNHLP